MIRDLLPASISEDAQLIAGLVTWASILLWMYLSGWRIQRRYFIEATRAPLRRNGIVWACAIIGAVIVVAAQERPAAPAAVSVSMIGALSAFVDARTHRLPNGYTSAMAVGVAFGLACGLLVHPDPVGMGVGAAAGALIWFFPALLLNRIRGGLGMGDVKLAPVLGTVVGAVGVDAAVGGFVLAFVAAGLAALWRIIVGSAGTDSRMPMGPWLIGAAMSAHLLWGVVPDWL
ncbi:A24 family peptidase [Actinomyces sp. B33]|uniref:prepilin peptidase n=1 Tax=Actinomyces sp. B33 TaxID=2942131 RepID=UPI002340B276|nr:A24 family peptidase [Actinomyces sp. B33]MDC4233250.1 A24 family peptidase [Actinomyces sp. B33]